MARFIAAAAIVGTLALAAGAALGAEAGWYAQPALHGDRLVFASEGDLWTVRLPAAGAQAAPLVAHRLTGAAGDESRPSFSPDGRWLAFTGQYDGNTDVFVMPSDGGAPRRLTYHPEAEVALGFTPDGAHVLFRSAAAHPTGRPELWRVPATGGPAVRYDLGEASLAALHPDGRRLAFTRWSNETWSWKRYRGGTAPDVWVGDLSTNAFRRLTDAEANDLFPMWVGDRVAFLSDRTGTANVWWDRPEGGDAAPLTRYAPKAGDPTAVEGYDVRWPSADAAPGSTRIAFVQAGDLVVLDAADGTTRRLDVRLASDRVAARERFEPPTRTATAFTLSRDGKTLWLESRGEILAVPSEAGLPVRHVTGDSQAREWGVTPLGPDRLAMVSDAGGEPALFTAPADGSSAPAVLSTAGEGWLFPPAASPDGRWVAFGDKALHLHVVEVATGNGRLADASDAWEIRDYRFSPDGRWLAYVKPLRNGNGRVMLFELASGRTVPVSSDLVDDREPRWDPAGRYLYLLSRRHMDPVISDFDFEHAYLDTTVVVAVPLAKGTPPPLPEEARAAGFDLEAWGKARGRGRGRGGEEDEEDDEAPEEPKPAPPVEIDADGLPERHVVLPIPPGEYASLEAVPGGVLYLSVPRRGLLSERGDRGDGALGRGRATLLRRDLAGGKSESSEVASGVRGYAVSGDGRTVALPTENGVRFKPLRGEGRDDERAVDVSGERLRVDIRREWAQMLREAWRLQRDFYWAPTYRGVDWPGMWRKYEALLPRVGTRSELNDLIGQMIGELATSHTYVWGGEQFERPRNVSVGLLGADLGTEGDRHVVRRVLRVPAWAEGLRSPLAAPHLAVKDGSVVLAVEGTPVTAATDLHAALQDRADRPTRIELADDATGANKRTITVEPLSSERDLRYAAWVEANRRTVEERSGGLLGYVHVPDMGGEGLVAFGRLFYPQFTKRGLVVDIRDNGGGFVSQMIVRRLDRRPWAFMQPRHGVASRYPEKSLHGHMAVLIDQHAGSDGDIFPASFRILGLGPLIGTRTWGGVVGIRSDKPFVDLGMSTQPEFAWWSPRDGWSVENRGVSPDVEVDISPEDRVAGRDPQLDRAVDWLLEKLRTDPRDLPSQPPYPDR